LRGEWQSGGSEIRKYTVHDKFNRWRVVSLVGGVAQWLGRRSVAGGLSLIYA